MSFVKDEDSFTRGPGAIAAMDAASPGRRIAAARAEARLRAREVLTQGAIETGQEAAFSRPPPAPTRPGKGGRPLPTRFPVKLPFRPKGLDFDGRLPIRPGAIKLPGTVITPPKNGEIKPTQTATPTQAPVAPLPTKGSVSITAAPGIVPIISGGRGGGGGGGAPSDDNAPPPFDPEPEAPAAPAAAAPAAKKPNYLLYAAIGLGAWWLLTRK